MAAASPTALHTLSTPAHGVIRSVWSFRRVPSPAMAPARCAVVGAAATAAVAVERGVRRSVQLAAPPELVEQLVEEALVWCSQHGLVVGDKNHPVKPPCRICTLCK